MLWHVVLFKLKNNISERQVNRMIMELKDLQRKIPEIQQMHVGPNLSSRGQGHAVMALSSFASKQDLQTYSEHPEHRRVIAQFIDPIRESVTVGDMDGN